MKFTTMLSCFSLAISLGIFAAAGVQAGQLIIGGSGTDLGTMQLVAGLYKTSHPDSSVQILSSLGSSGGIRGVAKGRIHIGLASRALKPREQSLPVKAYHYARTPLVLATHPDNNATNISLKTYIAALKGEKQYWPDGQLIRLVLRPSNDSDTLLLKQAYPETASAFPLAYQLRGVPVAQTDQDSADEIAVIQGSLGTSTLALIHGEQRPLRPLSLDGVAPTLENVLHGRYTLVKELYLVVADAPDADTLNFLRFLTTPEVRQLLESTGHVAINFEPN